MINAPLSPDGWVYMLTTFLFSDDSEPSDSISFSLFSKE